MVISKQCGVVRKEPYRKARRADDPQDISNFGSLKNEILDDPYGDECSRVSVWLCRFIIPKVQGLWDHIQSPVGFMHMLNLYSCHGASFRTLPLNL